MKFHKSTAHIYVPSGEPASQALAKTTHMGIGAHQDDLEFMAYHGIAECFGSPDKHFAGVDATNGSGSPRSGLYAGYTDEQMMAVRRMEQNKAAFIGEYCAQVFLDFTSGEVKDASNAFVAEDIRLILEAARPRVLYTHNLADKHDTHVAVALRTIQAVRQLKREDRPETIYGCEVWRGLDWLNDEDKVALDVGTHENLAAALAGVFDSQISGGKRYDLASAGRQRANATFFSSHAVDEYSALLFAVDLTPLALDEGLDPLQYMKQYMDRFVSDVADRMTRLSKS